jgi:UDP-N-acetyl-2-amino-2-deoxyglucuronate dehydrogenase
MDGGGAIMNQTIHTIDLLLAMMGVPTEVFAYAASLAHGRIEVEDTAVAVVRFASGALGVIHGTTAAYPGLEASVWVFGTKGSAVIADDHLVYFHRNPGPAPELPMPPPAADTNQITGRRRADRRAAPPGLSPCGPVRRLRRRDQVGSTGPGRHPGGPRRAPVVLGLYKSAAAGEPVLIEDS